MFTDPEGNIVHGAMRKSCADPAQSKTLSMCGNSLHGNREIPEVPADSRAGRSEKAKCRTSDMHASGKSDGCIVPEKPSNKGGGLPAEVVEERQPTKGNTSPTVGVQTLSWNAPVFLSAWCTKG